VKLEGFCLGNNYVQQPLAVSFLGVMMMICHLYSISVIIIRHCQLLLLMLLRH